MEQNRTKQRVVGGIILVSIAVIILPMILSESGEREISGSNIPVKPDHLVRTEIIPLEIKKLSGSSDVVKRKVIEQPEVKPIAVAGSILADIVLPEPKPVSSVVAVVTKPAVVKEVPAKKIAAPVAVSGWIVQVGSFSSESNAFVLRDKLRKKNFTSFVERVEGNKVIYRVRIGPELKKEQAEQHNQRLKKEFEFDGLVMLNR